MSKRPKKDCRGNFIPPTMQGLRPGDFAIGSLESRAASRAMLVCYENEQRTEQENRVGRLTPIEKALIEDVDIPGVKVLIIRQYRVAKEKEKLYGQKLPSLTPQDIRRNRAVAAAAKDST